MDFDEIEYLEKTVEEPEDRDSSKKKREGNEKSERSYRKREVEDEERKGKRSRGSEEEIDEKSSRDREKDRHRRDREKDRDGERDRDRERSSREKERDSERERDRERSSREKERDGERERDRDRDRERSHRERDKERERERRDRVKEKEREREWRDRDKEKGDERDGRERSRSRSRRHESDREKEREVEMRESRRLKEKKEAVEPEVDPERDQRTVFAYQMPLKASERDVYEFFSKAGKVRDVRLIMDRNSRRSKGVGYNDEERWEMPCTHVYSILAARLRYIEFYDVMSVPMAIALSGQLLLGQPVMVKPSEAEKNLVQSNASAGSTGTGTGPYGPVDRKLYVGNLHFSMTEMQLRQLFEPFGTVELVQLPLDLETGQCKGFGFVQFAQVENAKLAQSALNGKLEIAGRTIKVSSVTEHGAQQDTTAKAADFDDDEGGGLALNAQSRAMLMQKLDRTGIAASITGAIGVPMVNGSAMNPAVSLAGTGQAAIGAAALPSQVLPAAAYEPIGQPSECLLLKNMFDPATETEPDFDLDIKEDVEEECSKYGRVKHIHVEKNSAGFVYLRFESVEAAAQAQRAMHMRWFARRSISAIFLQPYEYDAKFSRAA